MPGVMPENAWDTSNTGGLQAFETCPPREANLYQLNSTTTKPKSRIVTALIEPGRLDHLRRYRFIL